MEQHTIDSRLSIYDSFSDAENILEDGTTIHQSGVQPRVPASQKEDSTGSEPQEESQLGYHIFRYWKWELASLGFTTSLLATMFVLLAKFDRRPTPDWKLPISLSALLSLLTTAFRISILIPITSVISHSKWDLVGRSQVRLLSDIQRLDDASRGPWGAIRVIPLVARGNIPALMAALCSLLNLATGPFVQQALMTVSCEQPVPGLAVVRYAHFVPTSRGDNSTKVVEGIPGVLDRNDIPLMVHSCQTGSGKPDNRIEANCATGNCTFPFGDPLEGDDVSHSTIALCHRCVDTTLSSPGRFPSLSSRVQLGLVPGLTINSIVDSNLTWTGDVAEALEVRRLASATLLNVTSHIAGANNTYTSGTCVLYTCLRSYQTYIRRGQLVESELPSIPASLGLFNPMLAWDKNTLAVVKSPCRTDDNANYSIHNMSTAPDATQFSLCETSVTKGRPCQVRNISAPEECIYRQDGPFGGAMRSTLATAFTGNCTVLECHSPFSSGSAWLSDLQRATRYLTESGPVFQRIDDAFGAFAVSMSFQYRMNYGRLTMGRTWQTMSCTSSQPAWITLPAALTVATASLLAWAVAGSWARRHVQPVWKESLLPLVLYKDRILVEDKGITRSVEKQPIMELRQIVKLADKTPVRFQWNGQSSCEIELRKGRKCQADVDSLLQESG